MPSSFERVAHQAPLAMGFSRQEYWSGLPFPSPGDLPDSGTELRSPALQADSTIWATRESPWMRNPGTFNLNAIATRSLKRLQSKKKKKVAIHLDCVCGLMWCNRGEFIFKLVHVVIRIQYIAGCGQEVSLSFLSQGTSPRTAHMRQAAGFTQSLRREQESGPRQKLQSLCNQFSEVDSDYFLL